MPRARFALLMLFALFCATPAAAGEPAEPEWDALLSLSDGARPTPRTRNLRDGTPFDAAPRDRAPRDLGEFGGAARRFFAQPKDHARGVLRDEGEFRRFHPAEHDAFDARWAETPRANPYVHWRGVNARVSPYGLKDYHGTDAYIAPDRRPLSRDKRRTYRAGAWTSEEIRRRLTELYGRSGCCGE